MEGRRHRLLALCQAAVLHCAQRSAALVIIHPLLQTQAIESHAVLSTSQCYVDRMVWWLACPAGLAAAAFALYGWKGLAFWTGQAVGR